MNIILFIGAVLGLLSMMMAAYVDHSLAVYLTGKSLSAILTAVKYHQLYAIVICVLGLSIPWQINHRIRHWLTRTAYIFSVGVILFSFSIYFTSILHITGVVYLTPVGGVLLMIGWVCLIRAALLRIK
jgi:uncharacterized membrane protein YgdD (TMEM256/DUF423 family)